MDIRYLAKETAPMYAAATGTKKIIELLWGDRVEVLEAGKSRSKVRARNKYGYVSSAALGDTPLLEVYFIDVGQGDGVLIRTPDGRHIMIDGGFKRASQPVGKNAADFVDWKFAKDYGSERIHLDAMIASHNDADHYGGLSDLLNVKEIDELDARDVRVDSFYHAGVAWWINPNNGQRWLGPVSPDKKFLLQLMGERAAVKAALDDDAEPKLQGEWAQFMNNVIKAKTIDNKSTPIHRLSHFDGYLPGFDGSDNGAVVRILAPVETTVDGKPALHNFGSNESKNTNGNSIMLRLDYGRSRILLTGDLNADSQRRLLDDYAGNRMELQCDVVKACHHGSDDVSYEFLNAQHPAVTVISSGDNEGFDHPRPGIVAASATTGYLEIADDRIRTPLIYSTELARSINLGRPSKLTIPDPAGDKIITGKGLGEVKMEAKVTNAGDLNAATKTKALGNTYVVTGITYGLVNVRTDGEKILCATLNEKDSTWQVKTLTSRF